MTASHSFYVAFGAIGFILNLIVALAINGDKTRQNATYRFMVHLAVADAWLVLGLVLGPHAAFVAGYDLRPDSPLGMAFAYFNGFGYHAAVMFMVMVAFSRWVHFARKGSSNFIFGQPRQTIMSVSIWVFVIVFLSPFLYCPDSFALVPETGLYFYNNSTYSYVLQTFDEIVNVCAVFLQAMFNLMSIYWIMKLRKEILTPELLAKKQGEVKLFFLCVIDCTIFFLLIAVHYCAMYGPSGPILDMVMEILFLLNHIDCALLYLCLNRKMRMNILGFVKVSILKIKSTTIGPTTTGPMINRAGGRNGSKV